MKIGLDSYSYRYAAGIWGWQPAQPLTPEGYLRRAQELGLAGVQFADLGHFVSLETPYLTALRRQADEAGLYLELGTGGTDPAHLGGALRAAADLGSPVLRTFAGGFRWEAETTGAALVERAARDLREVAPVAQRLGVRVALENHLDLRAEEMLDLLRRVGSEYVGICLDTGNPYGLLEDPLAAAQALAPYTFTTHLKEFRVVLRRGGLVLRGVALGRGDVPNLEIVEELRRHAPLGEDLHLNVETAVERVVVPVLRGDFTSGALGIGPGDLLTVLRRLDLDRPCSSEDLAPPEELGQTAEEVLAGEHAQVAASTAWALERFG